ncbi:MAG: hypothetical protein Fur0037_21200 [Planctomycetota bacterium]
MEPCGESPLSAEQKDRLRAENLARLERDLWEGRLVYESSPRVADVQFSNFCNMSCTMCYDGQNPPLKKLPPELLERFAKAVFPAASVLVPFVGSEPLIVTWDLVRETARRYGLELDLITNAQFLDEAKFRELEPFVSSITFSIDSHMPDVYASIRLRSRPDRVFANLPVAARLCREHGIEAQANVVYMVENAPFLDDTVAYLADQGVTTVRLLQYIRLPHISPERDFSNATLHLSEQWRDWMNERIRRVAEQKGIRVLFDFAEKREFDYRPKDLTLRPDRKVSPIFERLVRYYPGYCWQSVDRVKIHADGRVYPCCVGTGDDLVLGDLNEKPFEQIWNGPEAQDLRRGMMTGDVPDFCRSCSFHTSWIAPEQPHLPIEDWFFERVDPRVPRVAPEGRVIEIESPAHMARVQDPPTFRWKRPDGEFSRFAIAMGPGGEWNDENVAFLVPGDRAEFTPDKESWEKLRPNLGWWWCLFAIGRHGQRSLRSRTVRCLIRRKDLPRVEGSRLFGRGGG